MCLGLHLKCPYKSCQILIKIEFSRHIFEKRWDKKVLWKSIPWKPTCSMQADRNNEGICRFSQFCTRYKNHYLLCALYYLFTFYSGYTSCLLCGTKYILNAICWSFKQELLFKFFLSHLEYVCFLKYCDLITLNI
jgi:hypothetical protein